MFAMNPPPRKKKRRKKRGTVKIKPSKLQTVTRCAFCHADDGEMEKCSGCGTLLHPECEKENGKCPTLGCAKPVRSESLRPARDTNLAGAPGWFTPRREGLYDTETWGRPGAGIITFGTGPALTSATVPYWTQNTNTAGAPNFQNYANWFRQAIPYQQAPEFAEPTEPDPMNTTEQF